MTAHIGEPGGMKALILNGTLKPSPEPSNTGALATFVGEQLAARGAEVELIRLVDEHVAPGVVSEAVHDGDGWPRIHDRVVEADIVVFATPTWMGQPGSVIKGALERLDALISETQADGTPMAFNKVAGFVVTGNEDGAHACIAAMAQAAIDIGFTVPGQAWTYWNKGPGPSDASYLTAPDEEKEWTHSTGEAMAHVLTGAAAALAATPIAKPPNA
jgi:multimeric flavodoxin WrbA